MRTPHLILALLFALFAVVQLNDPDPTSWFLAYGSVALLFGLSAFGRFQRLVTAVLAAALTVWLLVLIPGFVAWIGNGAPSIVGSMQAEAAHIEVVREFLGLLIAVVALVYLMRSGKA